MFEGFPRQRNCVLGKLLPARHDVEHRQGHRQPCRHQSRQTRLHGRQQSVCFFQQVDLLAVEHVDLEPGGSRAEAQRGLREPRCEIGPTSKGRGPEELPPRALAITAA